MNREVSNLKEIVDNVFVFNKELPKDKTLIRKLSTFQHWYFVEELNGFGPSKFIGYKENNAEKYREGSNRISGYMDGRETVVWLKKWFRKANESEVQLLMPKLKEFLSNYDKLPNSRVNLHVEIK